MTGFFSAFKYYIGFGILSAGLLISCSDQADSDDGIPDTKVKKITDWSERGSWGSRVVLINDTFICVQYDEGKAGGISCMVAPGEELPGNGFVNELRQGAMDLR